VRELLGGLYFGERAVCGVKTGTPSRQHDELFCCEIDEWRACVAAALKRSKKVTSVDKANVLETSQLWRATVSRVGRDYPA